MRPVEWPTQGDAVSELAPQDSVLPLDVLELSEEIMAEHCLELSDEGKC